MIGQTVSHYHVIEKLGDWRSPLKKPLWQCPRCGRRFANRNQAHGCTDLTVSDCLEGKSDRLVEIFHAFEAAVRSCGEVRVHPTRARIAFIARMTFAGASLRRDHVEAAVMLPYRSQESRFYKFLPSGTGGAHWFKLTQVADIDDKVRRWLAEAYRCGLQEPAKPKLSKNPKTAPLPAPLKKSGTRTRGGKIFYIHWNEKELLERSSVLRKAGYEVLAHGNAAVVAKLADFVPDVVVISLDRLPSHGRAYAGWIWEAKRRQSIPIVFAGGQPEKVLIAKHQFPKAIFCASHEVPDIVSRLLH